MTTPPPNSRRAGPRAWADAVGALRAPAWIAVALAGTAAVVLSISLASVVTTLFTHPAGTRDGSTLDEKQMAEKLAKNFDRYAAQINGRSMFFDPPAPSKPAPPPEPETDEASPAAPTRYGGPALIGFAHGTAWFADGKKLREGESAGSDLKLKKLQAPWGALVEWQGVEFSVDLFDKDRLVLPRDAEPPSTPPPSDKPAEPSPAPIPEQPATPPSQDLSQDPSQEKPQAPAASAPPSAREN